MYGVNYQSDEVLPPGVAIVIAIGTAGAGDPDIQDVFDVIGDEQYNVIATPYTSAAAMMALETELANRWGPASTIDGVAIAGFRGTAAEATTYGNVRNSPHVSVMGISSSPMPTYEWAAAIAAQVAQAGEIDPARPFQTLPLRGILPAQIDDRWTFTERNTVLRDGISTHVVDRAGLVRLERMVTTYQTSAAGIPDLAYMDLNTPMTLSYLRNDFGNYIRAKYPRHKLADDGTRIGPGQAVITPSVGRAEAISRFRQWEFLGLVEDADAFKEGLICIRDPNDRNRLNWLLTPDLINQFRIGGVQISFIL